MERLKTKFQEYDEIFVPYKSYYQSKDGIKYWSDLWTWIIENFEPKQVNPVENRVMPKIADKEIEQKLLWLDNLLCTIHRDGGDFISENGYQKAYDKAMEKIINWLPIT